MSAMSATERRSLYLKALGRALFLACSWTWCIGMWFPVYVIGEHGLLGWAAFLIPNAVGAAAMGAVLNERTSRSLVGEHVGAMRAFSVVTILFHASWLAWLLSDMFSESVVRQGWVGGMLAAATVIGGFGLGCVRSPQRWTIAAILVFALSIAAWSAISVTSTSLQLPRLHGAQDPWSLAVGFPILAMGFLLCPYLDATFHRVRIDTPGPAGTASFGLGFGLFFPLLMVFTLFYAGGIIAGKWSYYLWIHFTAQSAFTIGAHVRELMPDGLVSWNQLWPRRRAQLAGLVVLALCSSALPFMPTLIAERPNTRLVYELFMSCYGLLFPAYVWIVMNAAGAARRQAVRVWACTCIAMAPPMWMGYVSGERWWLPVVVGVVIAARFFVRRAQDPGHSSAW